MKVYHCLQKKESCLREKVLFSYLHKKVTDKPEINTASVGLFTCCWVEIPGSIIDDAKYK